MKSKTILILSLLICLSCQVFAVHTIKPVVDKEGVSKEVVLKKKSKRQGFFKRVIHKAVVKKLNKLQVLYEKSQVEKDSELGLLLGIGSMVSLFLGLVSPIFLLIAAILAIIGDVVCIKVLSSTSYDKDGLRRPRAMAKAGLSLSLLTGILPLLALLAVILS